MNKQIISIQSVLPGWSPSEFFYQRGQFLNSVGIDPEMPKDDSGTKPSGLLRPTAMEKISGTAVTGAPLWMETTNKNDKTYVYASDGKVHVVEANLAMGTALNSSNALTTASGNGLAFYNNYLYGASNTDIWRYGPLNGTPNLVQNFWTGLSLTALANTTYPTINGVKIPNHPMFLNPKNNRLYFGDVDSNGVGILSMIKTKKVTVEGDTNDTTVPSSYKVLDFYYGWYPTCIDSVGTELAIGLINGVETGMKQKNAQVAFWSTVASDTSYSRIATLPDPIITAMRNVNGVLYVFTGTATGGMRVSRYLGGEQFEEIYYSDDQFPPLQGAVDYQIGRIVYGASTTTPIASASVMAIGSKSRALNMGVHNILKATAGATTPWVTALKYTKQGATAQPIVGWKDNTGTAGALVCGIDKISTTYGTAVWRSQVFSWGKNGTVESIRIPFAQAVGANMTLTVKVYVDDATSGTTACIINNTLVPTGKRSHICFPAIQFENNFFIELTWSGTALLTVSTPIDVAVSFLER